MPRPKPPRTSAADNGNAVVTVISGEVQLASPAGHETLGERARGSVESAGTIAVASTTALGVAALRDTVRPAPELNAANADRRLQALRRQAADQEAAVADLAQRNPGVKRDEPGTGDSTFEGSTPGGASPADNSGERTPDMGVFDPSTMAHVRVSVQVRP